MRFGRYELRWNWHGWRDDMRLGAVDCYYGTSSVLVGGWSLWWLGPWELWRYDG